METTPGSGHFEAVARPDPDLLYDRSVRTQARMDGSRMVVTATLADETLGPSGYVRIHEMSLSITVEPETMTIVEASAEMWNFPHGMCPSMAPSAESLVGLNVSVGYLGEVRSRMGGVRGCNHLYALAQSVGTVAALTFVARRIHGDPAIASLPPPEYFADVVEQAPGVVNTCYVWRRDGEIAAHLLGPQE